MIQENTYMNIAYEIAKNSYCNRRKVGALIVKDGNILAFGYNGTPSKHNNSCEENGKTKREVIHAEVNAIAKCAKTASSTFGSTLYCTLMPCIECAKIIVACGINKVVYCENYPDESGIKLLIKNNIDVQKL